MSETQEEPAMRLYQTTTEFNCGVDLHARQMYVCVVDREGKVLVHRNIRDNDFEFFLKLVGPYRHSLTVCSECCFCWYWLADKCAEAGIPFVLAHALYLRSIQADKKKNDRVDSEKIAHLLRTSMIPYAYVYPRGMRPLRSLLRRRMAYVWRRAEMIGWQTCGLIAEGLPETEGDSRPRERWEQELLHRHTHEHLRLIVETDLAVIREYDRQIDRLERAILSASRRDRWRDLNVLLSVPGVGEVLAMTLLYEIGDINRFDTHQQFASYCRLVKGSVESAGVIKGMRGGKMGNGYLKWAMKEAVLVAKRSHPQIRAMAQQLQKRHDKPTANAILAHRLARAIYYILKHGMTFSMELFSKRSEQRAA
jgi:transposase